MVLSWRPGPQPSSASPRVVTGQGDVAMFFFFFDNVGMRGKDESEKAFALLAYLDGAASEFYFQTFTMNGTIIETKKDFSVVKKHFWKISLKRRSRKRDPGGNQCFLRCTYLAGIA